MARIRPLIALKAGHFRLLGPKDEILVEVPSVFKAGYQAFIDWQGKRRNRGYLLAPESGDNSDKVQA